MTTTTAGDAAADADLEVGAEAIAQNIFGGKLTPRQIYRLATRGWPIFRIQGKLAARPSAMRAEMERREAAAASAQLQLPLFEQGRE